MPIAAHQVLTQLWMLSSFLLDSLAVGGQTLVAVHVGRDAIAAREISDRLLEVRVIGSKVRMSAYGSRISIHRQLTVHQDENH